MTNLESRLVYPESIDTVVRDMPALIGSIATLEDKIEMLRAVQAAGKVAEGLLTLLEIRQTSQNDSEATEPFLIPADTPLVQPAETTQEESFVCTSSTQSDTPFIEASIPELAEDAEQEVGVVETVVDIENPEIEVSLQESDIERILEDFKGQRKLIAEWFLRNPGQQTAPYELHYLIDSPTKSAKKQLMTYAMRQIRMHPRMSQWLRESGSRKSLKYWIELDSEISGTDTSSTGEGATDVAQPSSEKNINTAGQVALTAVSVQAEVTSTNRVPAALGPNKVVSTLMMPARRIAQSSVSEKSETESISGPGVRESAPNPAVQADRKNPAKVEKVLETWDKEFINGATEVRELGVSGLRVLEKNGVRKVFHEAASLRLNSLELAIIEIVADNEQGLLFGELRELINDQWENPLATKALSNSLENIREVFSKKNVRGWLDEFVVDEDKERWRRIKIDSPQEPEQVA